ncbi:MAG TPA: hypothetical protein VHH53_07050, partial [Pseudonocardiaceae bacterium]|nr:hypothetical protein [Pseudonocardiaceae bacterium]
MPETLRVLVPWVIELFARIRMGRDPAQSTRTHPATTGATMTADLHTTSPAIPLTIPPSAQDG